MTYLPSTELVVVAWLKGITALGNGVAVDLPADTSGWPTIGTPAGPFFVQVTTVGGSGDAEILVDSPVVSIDVYAANAGGSKPPWARASQIAEVIRAAARDHTAIPRKVTLPTGYGAGYVHGVQLVGPPPRRVPGDQATYAHYVMELQFDWSAV